MMLHQINLNLLKTLHILLRVRSVTLASQDLFLTQPAVSMALKQLRVIFNDPLLVKGEGALFGLTHKAKQIQPELEKIINELDTLIQLGTDHFDISTARAQVRICSHPSISISLIPELYGRIKKYAPGICITQNTVAYSSGEQSDYAAYDFLIGPYFEDIKNSTSVKLFDVENICLSGNEKLNRKNKLTLKDLQDNEFVILAYREDFTRSIVSRALAKNGLHRKYTAVVYDLDIAAQMAKDYGLLMMDIKTKHQEAAKRYGLKQFDLPFEPPMTPFYLAYQMRDENNPVIQWVKNQIIEIMTG